MNELTNKISLEQLSWQSNADWHDDEMELVERFLDKNTFILDSSVGLAVLIREEAGQGEVLAALHRTPTGKIVNLLTNKRNPIFQLPMFVESAVNDQRVLTLKTEDVHELRQALPFFVGDEDSALAVCGQSSVPLFFSFLGSKPYGEKEKAFLETSFSFLMEAIKNKREKRELTSRLYSLENIFNTTKVLTSEKSVEDKLSKLAGTAMEMLQGQYSTVRLVQREALELATEQGLPIGFEQMDKESFGISIDDWTVRKGKTVTIDDITAWPAIEYERQANCLRSVVSVPLRLKHRVVGVISIYSTVPRTPSLDILNRFLVIADQAAIVIEDAMLMTRSALLQEVHHRVKNNLQMVAGLLSLAATSNRQAPIVKEYLQESVNRVKTMAIIHGLLSEKGDGLTDLTELINRLGPLLLNLQVTNTRKVEIKVKGPTILLGSKEATCLALAINELFCNSLMHGMADFRDGYVSVEIVADKVNLLLKIQDNGKGFPPGFDWRKQKGLGLKIVEALVERDLRGSFRFVSNQEGALAVLVIPTSVLRKGGVMSGTG